VSLRTPPSRVASAAVRDLVAHSTQLLTSHQAPSGAFPAAPNYAVYQYSWLRDGAFIAEGLSRHGAVAAADAFHRWCANAVQSRAAVVAAVVRRLKNGETVPHEDFLPTRYTLDGNDTGEDWWDFQTDGYGAWLWSLHQHVRRHAIDATPYRDAVETTATYLQHVWSQPCYDWWEEHPEHQHVSTLGSIAAGLDSALKLRTLDAERASAVALQLQQVRDTLLGQGLSDGHLVKWLGSHAVDGSLLSCVAPFGLLDDDTARATLAAVEEGLVYDNGVYRYLDDTFYGGGRWPVLTAFRGMALAALDRGDDALNLLEWIASSASLDGSLPEQVGGHLLHPEHEKEWIERWGPVASPLLWSHGMFLMLADELGVHA
jgi:isomaltose glucohydrolase